MIMIYDNLYATISASIKIDTVIPYGKCTVSPDKL